MIRHDGYHKGPFCSSRHLVYLEIYLEKENILEDVFLNIYEREISPRGPRRGIFIFSLWQLSKVRR